MGDRLRYPSGEPQALRTPEGLRYWVDCYAPTIGNVVSVVTDDPEISMHEYRSLEREYNFSCYLFRYRGTAMGFVLETVVGGRPLPERSNPEPAFLDAETNIFHVPICHIGTPVFDVAAGLERGPDGRLIRENGNSIWDYRPKPEGARKDYYVTGLDWSAYDAGRRDTFPSWQVQAEMLALWPVLFEALLASFMRFQPDWTGRADDGRVLPIYKMRFGKALLQELAEGRYVADRG